MEEIHVVAEGFFPILLLLHIFANELDEMVGAKPKNWKRLTNLQTIGYGPLCFLFRNSKLARLPVKVNSGRKFISFIPVF